MIHTLCPACGTTFRVTPEQLKARQGKVRCGKCQHVFNAIETLDDVTSEPAGLAPVEFQPEFDAMAEPPAEVSAEVADSSSSAVEAQEERSWPDIEPPPEPALVSASRRRSWPWMAASALALVLLALQLTVRYRVELSVLAPNLKPALRVLCAPLDCDLPLPHVSDLVSIESSDLHPDTRQKDQLILVATLKNRAPFAQAFPNLELALTDTLDKTILRRVLVPTDYLAKEALGAGAFARNSEIAVNLVLKYDNGAGPAASGYRLYLFYP